MKSAYSIQSIRTEADYQYALSLVAPYFDNEPTGFLSWASWLVKG